MVGAARIFFSLPELAERLNLRSGHVIEMAEGAPNRPGVILTIVGPDLPKDDPFSPISGMLAAQYYGGGGHQPDEQPAAYTPAKAPVQASDSTRWPKFPGEDLPVTGDKDALDPTKIRQPFHAGGPR